MSVSPDVPAWRRLPLSGTSLIEASAGTGKTWNIALLYLRALLERKLGARQILVTTFTEAAAQELRARIRARLLDAERMATTASRDATDLDAYLAERCATQGRAAVLARLRLAIADIDLAPIATIHGFCRRVLGDFPFDTGEPFTPGEIVDEGQLIANCVRDFWRRRYLGNDVDPLEAMAVVPYGAERLATLTSKLLAVPAHDRVNGDAQGLRDWWALLCGAQQAELRSVVSNTALFARSNSALRARLASLLEHAERGDPTGVDWHRLGEMLEPGKLRGHSGLRSMPLDRHPLLGPWSALAASMRRIEPIIRADVAEACARFVDSELRRRLRAQGLTTYAQLIAEVHDRLHAANGARLAARLRGAWPFALIDEFQDTDARQWAIFERIYRQPEVSDDSALVLIGDPKQSIYAFRGADIHAYLAARDGLAAGRQFSIRQNFRSHPRLLAALNRLYTLAGDLGFGASAIRHVAVESGHPDRFAADHNPRPLRLRLLRCGRPGLGERDPLALATCANDIVALLADPASGVTPGDIAVLVDSNRRIAQMRELLIERGVPVVGSGRTSVLATAWADDLQLLLHALLHPNDEYAVRGALATRLLGVSARELTELAGNAHAWEARLDQFARWRRTWERCGALAVIEAVILEQAPRLLAGADGERALTDLRHLGELLQDAGIECYGPEELYAWFVGERSAGAERIEAARAQQLRIESEARRVQLLTVHASKGLEYPVVFVPTAWRAAKEHTHGIDKDLARHHDAGHRLRLDLGSADFAANKASERREGLQERLRALYVAITRAQSRCILYAFDDCPPLATIIDSDRGALEVLLGAALHAASARAQHDAFPWELLAAAVPTLDIDRVRDPTPLQHYRDGAADQPERSARSPLPAARPGHGHYSFTALTRDDPAAAVDTPQWAEDEPAAVVDSLAAAESPDVPDPRLTVLARIKGARFGDAVHQLLEQGRSADTVAAALRRSWTLQSARIAAALDQQSVRLDAGRESEQLAAIADLLDRTLDAPLAAGLRLGALAATACRPEFEFAFAVEAARWHRLHELLHAHSLGHWWPPGGGKRVLRGLMKGYVDLVFAWDGRYHVLDYKTSWLGEGRLSDYHPQALDAAMVEHRYGLQALIYTVAVHRYLAHRLDDYDPATHLGDSWYLFVRGIGLDPLAGIWRKRFAPALIEALDALFDGAEVGP